MGPPNLKEMEVMFSRIHVTGETASIPGEISSSSDDDVDMEVKENDEVEELTPRASSKNKKKEFVDVDELTPGSSSKNNKKKEGKILGKRKTKPVDDEEDKNPFLRVIKQTCANINARVTGEGPTNLASTNNAPTMAEVLNLMVECGAKEGTPLFHTATKIVMKPAYRELFMLIKTREGRLDWLKREHEEMSK